MNVLVWLKRDLRITDHPALTLAAGLGPVLPLSAALVAAGALLPFVPRWLLRLRGRVRL